MEGIMQQCLPPPHPYPWLLYWKAKGAEDTHNFCAISDSTKTYSRLQEFGAARLWSHQHGWYHRENATKLYLWNRSNFTKIELPLLEHKKIFIIDCILISSPTEPEQVCSIFLFSDPSSRSIFYWYLGDEQWTHVDYRKQLMSAPLGEEFDEARVYICNPFCFNGCLYAESYLKPDLLLEIKKVEPCGLEINSTHIFFPRVTRTSLKLITRMLELNNELFRIEILHAHNKVIAVVVHKLDFSRRVWLKVESIKDKAFFISDIDVGSSFVCEAINSKTGGRVFVTLKKCNFVYIYNIESRSLLISHPFLNLPEEHSLSFSHHSSSHPFWFMSDLRMTCSIKENIGKTRIGEKENSNEIHSKKTEDTVTTYDEFALPLDIINIIEAIAKRINNGIDYLHFRATNRFFRSSTPPIQRRLSSATSMLRFDHPSMSPLFVYFEKDNVLTFVHPKNGLKYKYNINLTMNLQPYCSICYSKDGWLLMALDMHSSFFFNPFTKEEKPLPNAPKAKCLNTQCMAFSHPPTSSEFVVVQLEWFSQLKCMMGNITFPGEKKWYGLDFEDFEFPLYNISPVVHKGAFYFLNKKGKLGVLKVGGGRQEEEEEVIPDWFQLDKPNAPCTNYSNSFLLECNDNLLSVFEGPFGKWVRVFKLNESTMTWIQVENLENHMLFVGHTSFSAVAHVSGMENKIYFPKFYGENIVFYSLETNNYHTFESNEAVNFHCMEEQVNSSWIEPRWH